jgi:hypothetical protein
MAQDFNSLPPGKGDEISVPKEGLIQKKVFQETDSFHHFMFRIGYRQLIHQRCEKCCVTNLFHF